MMIKTFPRFSKISLGHRAEVYSMTLKHEPYSDFNFTALYSFDTEGIGGLSILNRNLVIKIADYQTSEPIISMMGQHFVAKSLKTIIGQGYKIKLIPEEVIKLSGDFGKSHFIQDRDNFDYIYSLKNLSQLEGGLYKKKRNKINRFIKDYGNEVEVSLVDKINPGFVHKIDRMYHEWNLERDKHTEDLGSEKKALFRMLENSTHFNLRLFQTTLGGKLVAFSLNEKLPGGYVICHFQKCLVSYRDMDAYLTNCVSRQLLAEGCNYINWEQDLGIKGLRESKEIFKPIKKLKKFTYKE